MVDNGIVQYLLDGLDEVLSADELFFEEFLPDRITTPDGRAQITICVRDSLFNTCTALREFLEAVPPQHLEVIRLQRWNFKTKEAFAEKRFSDVATRKEFLSAVQGNISARELSDLALFCEFLAQVFEQGKLADVKNASSLCQLALENIIEREYEKKLLIETQITREDLFDFLEAAAAEQLVSDFAGVAVEELRVDAETYSAMDMSPEDRQQLVARLIQLAVFERSSDTTKVTFVHEILGFYLLALSLVSSLAKRPDFFATSMDNPNILARGILLGLLAELINSQNLQESVWSLLHSRFLPDAAFRGIIQAAVLAGTTAIPETIRSEQFCNRNLEGVNFSRVDLRRARFDNTDLTNVEFSDCDLRDASFRGAVIRGTHFDTEPDRMKGASFGGYASVFSVKVRGRYYDEPKAAGKALAELVQLPEPSAQPCPTAFQMRYLLQKFIKPNGHPWRDSLDIRGFLSGRKTPSAADNQELFQALCSRGYLTLNKRGERIVGVSRGTGAVLPETIGFVTQLRMSEGIKAALDETCPKKGCEHIPPTYT